MCWSLAQAQASNLSTVTSIEAIENPRRGYPLWNISLWSRWSLRDVFCNLGQPPSTRAYTCTLNVICGQQWSASWPHQPSCNDSVMCLKFKAHNRVEKMHRPYMLRAMPIQKITSTVSWVACAIRAVCPSCCSIWIAAWQQAHLLENIAWHCRAMLLVGFCAT